MTTDQVIRYIDARHMVGSRSILFLYAEPNNVLHHDLIKYGILHKIAVKKAMKMIVPSKSIFPVCLIIKLYSFNSVTPEA